MGIAGPGRPTYAHVFVNRLTNILAEVSVTKHKDPQDLFLDLACKLADFFAEIDPQFGSNEFFLLMGFDNKKPGKKF